MDLGLNREFQNHLEFILAKSDFENQPTNSKFNQRYRYHRPFETFSKYYLPKVALFLIDSCVDQEFLCFRDL